LITNVYIDGFNFYYAAVKGTRYKWLDFSSLCHLLLPRDSVHRIKYFTAYIKARPGDPDQAIRQQTYLRALKTIPILTIIRGHFLSHTVSMPLANSLPGKVRYAEVIKTELNTPAPKANHFLGREAHALFLDLVRRADPALAETLHQPRGDKPFTVSALLPSPPAKREGPGVKVVRAGKHYEWRITAFESHLAQVIAEQVLPLADFAFYCGTGYKTTQGMGQTRKG
jgi:CRISPR/Cas system endoribonuclease Cas6 (RAMP superfamily)